MEKPSRMRVKPEPAPLRRTRFPRGGSVGQRASAATSPTSPQGCETDVHEGQALGRGLPVSGRRFCRQERWKQSCRSLIESLPPVATSSAAGPQNGSRRLRHRARNTLSRRLFSDGFRNPSALRNSQVQERKLLDAGHWMYAVDDEAEINFFKVGSRDVTSRPSIPDSLASNRLKDTNTIRAHSGNSRDRSSADP